MKSLKDGFYPKAFPVCLAVLLAALVYGLVLPFCWHNDPSGTYGTLSLLCEHHIPWFWLWTVLTGLGLTLNLEFAYHKYGYSGKPLRIAAAFGLFGMILTAATLNHSIQDWNPKRVAHWTGAICFAAGITIAFLFFFIRKAREYKWFLLFIALLGSTAVGVLKIKNAAIVSLSSGILGEDFIRFELDIGLRRLRELGLEVKFMPNALKGLDFVKEHPEERAEDLLAAFRDPDIDMILCAIGGDDTYRLLPYLFGNDELARAVTDKVFLGFSDTTINHLMLHKVGLKTFYGQAFLPDICEMSADMHPYTRRFFTELITTGRINEITPSDVWYDERKSFSPDQAGISMPSHPDHGFELLQGNGVFSGRILGGCIDTIYDIFNGDRYADMPALCEK